MGRSGHDGGDAVRPEDEDGSIELGSLPKQIAALGSSRGARRESGVPVRIPRQLETPGREDEPIPVLGTDSAADLIVVCDTRGTIEYANPAFERITGHCADEVRGLPVGSVISNHGGSPGRD